MYRLPIEEPIKKKNYIEMYLRSVMNILNTYIRVIIYYKI